MKITTSLFSSLLFAASFGLMSCGGGGGESETDTTGGQMTTADPTEGATPSCDAYCTDILANCKDANAQYGDMAICMGACSAFDLGAAGDVMGNTVGCRTYHAGAAAMAPEMHCTHAGPGGDGACGADCDGFCAIAVKTCGSVYADETACMTACTAFKDDVAFSTAAVGGDSLACRLYHLTVATSSADMATAHCPHIAAVSDTCK